MVYPAVATYGVIITAVNADKDASPEQQQMVHDNKQQIALPTPLQKAGPTSLVRAVIFSGLEDAEHMSVPRQMAQPRVVTMSQQMAQARALTAPQQRCRL